MSDCNHDCDWMGLPAGCVPQSWECTECRLRMSAGEFCIWLEVRREIGKEVSELRARLAEAERRLEVARKEWIALRAGPPLAGWSDAYSDRLDRALAEREKTTHL